MTKLLSIMTCKFIDGRSLATPSLATDAGCATVNSVDLVEPEYFDTQQQRQHCNTNSDPASIATTAPGTVSTSRTSRVSMSLSSSRDQQPQERAQVRLLDWREWPAGRIVDWKVEDDDSFEDSAMGRLIATAETTTSEGLVSENELSGTVSAFPKGSVEQTLPPAVCQRVVQVVRHVDVSAQVHRK